MVHNSYGDDTHRVCRWIQASVFSPGRVTDQTSFNLLPVDWSKRMLSGFLHHKHDKRLLEWLCVNFERSESKYLETWL